MNGQGGSYNDFAIGDGPPTVIVLTTSVVCSMCLERETGKSSDLIYPFHLFRHLCV